MVPAGNKAKRLSSVNHTTKTIHYHHHKVINIQVFFKLHDRIELLLHYRNISISTFFRDVVLESWGFNTDPTIQEIYKLLIICSTIFLKLDLEISNMIYLLK